MAQTTIENSSQMMTANTLCMQELAGGKESAINVENKASKQLTAAQTEQELIKQKLVKTVAPEKGLTVNSTIAKRLVTEQATVSRRKGNNKVESKPT
jgi:hypothetical protein